MNCYAAPIIKCSVSHCTLPSVRPSACLSVSHINKSITLAHNTPIAEVFLVPLIVYILIIAFVTTSAICVIVHYVVCARCRGGDNATAARERRPKRSLGQQKSGGWVIEEPASRDDWETMVRYNENILQQRNLTVTTATDHRFPQVEKSTPQLNETASWRIERPSLKPPKPPKPTLPLGLQQTLKPLLPVQLFLNRQVLLFLDNVQALDAISFLYRII